MRGLWLWLGSGMLVVAAALVGAAATIGAGSKHYALWTGTPVIAGYICGFLALACFIAGVREAPFPLAVRSSRPRADIDTTFQYGNVMWTLVIGLLNRGPTLERATINVLVPGHPTRISRMLRDGSVAPGDRLTTSELVGGTPASYWSETEVRIPGSGVSTLLNFNVSVVGGQRLPVRLKIVADELREPYVVDGEIRIPRPPLPRTHPTP